MWFSDAHGRKVVSTTSAETVGKVSDFVVDPSTQSLVAVKIRKAESGDTLGWSDIVGFGADAVTVTEAGVIKEAGEKVAALAAKDHRLLGKRVLDTAGEDLGKIEDVAFDHETGSITSVKLQGGGELDGARLIGAGSYAVVLKAVTDHG